MKKFLKYLLNRVFYLRRIIYYVLGFFNAIVENKRNKIFVLCYHSFSDDSWRFSVSENNLKKQLKYLTDNFKPLDVLDIQEYLLNAKNINTPSFLITVDDGYKDLYKVKQIFQDYGIKPLIFVLSDSEKADRKELDNQKLFLTRDELINLKKEGWYIGCHSMTHANLTKLTGDQLRAEVQDSKIRLEKLLGFKIDFFAYPKGKYNTQVVKAVKDAGYKLGFSMDDDQISPRTNHYLIPRIGVDGSHSMREFKLIHLTTLINFRKLIKNSFIGQYL